MPTPMEQLQSATVLCRGGLDSNQNWLMLSQTNPGVASELLNFEPSLFGGYRRINGYAYLEDTNSGEVDPAGAEGRILGISIFGDDVIVSRKQQAGATYEFYRWSTGASWVKYTTGLTFVSTAVEKIRSTKFNFENTEKIVFVDGVNKATIFNGTDWIDIDSAATGANFANAGGPMALAAPKFVKTFQNHIFMAHCSNACQLIAHSAPKAEYDWTAASGAGQINVGFEIVSIHSFRDELFVFGHTKIKKIVVDANSGNFLVKDVTDDIGCLASDSVLEVGGDLYFIAPDGIRPISATQKINDVELASVSKNIQQDIFSLISQYENSEIHGVVIRGKSQLRYFFSAEGDDESDARGIIGAIRNKGDSLGWEFGNLQGIKVSCVDSGYLTPNTSLQELVVHGGWDGKVYRQEQGNNFNGNNISAVYSTPYIDFNSPSLRKTLQKIKLFCRPEGAVTIYTRLDYDWGSLDSIDPSSYSAETEGTESIYGSAVYGSATYGGITVPVLLNNVQGSGRSVKLTFSTNDTSAPYSIQGIVFEYQPNGFK